MMSLDDVAVVGMQCRFPDAPTVNDYWRLIHDGNGQAKGAFSSLLGRPFYAKLQAACQQYGLDESMVATAGLIEQPYAFDSQFFKMSGKEANAADPQTRLLLESCYSLLDESFVTPQGLAGSNTSLFVGMSSSDYMQDILLNLQASDAVDIYHATGNAASAAVGRVSHFFDWKGQSLALDTACSSSLVAVSKACHALQTQQTDTAIAGGVNLILSQLSSVAFMNANMLSPTANCKPFDAQANGYVRGEGCGLVMLKRLSDAVADGNTVHAVIKAHHINHDGQSNGITAPNPKAQTALLTECWQQAGLSTHGIDYLEAHGTGTRLGDPIEVKAIAAAVQQQQLPPVTVGSVKSNIGHLEAAAGVAGLIKAILVGKQGIIPAQHNFTQLNPLLARYS